MISYPLLIERCFGAEFEQTPIPVKLAAIKMMDAPKIQLFRHIQREIKGDIQTDVNFLGSGIFGYNSRDFMYHDKHLYSSKCSRNFKIMRGIVFVKGFF